MLRELRPRHAAFFFFFNDTATTEIYTLSLHDALPICTPSGGPGSARRACGVKARRPARRGEGGRRPCRPAAPVRGSPFLLHDRRSRRAGRRGRSGILHRARLPLPPLTPPPHPPAPPPLPQ